MTWLTIILDSGVCFADYTSCILTLSRLSTLLDSDLGLADYPPWIPTSGLTLTTLYILLLFYFEGSCTQHNVALAALCCDNSGGGGGVAGVALLHSVTLCSSDRGALY